MATSITSTQLDFNNIKNKLKTYLAQKSEFSDYDFEGSGLSNILDVLAYNTHFKGLQANFAINESFLHTAQLRASVIQHAESLGYRPRSVTTSRAYVELFLDLSAVSNRPARIRLATGTSFKAINQDNENTQTEYSFETREDYYATDNGNGIYQFLNSTGGTNITIYEGTSRTKTFIVDSVASDEIYVIPDSSIDTTSISVKVYEDVTSDKYEIYTPIQQAIVVDETSTYYDIKESPNGYYEINFGDGTSFGKKPSVGEKLVVQYSSSAGPDADGANQFTCEDSIYINGKFYKILIQSQGVSFGGAEKESIESIRKLAPIQFAAQQRLVTALDYKGMILSNFTDVKDVSVWGGEDNVPIDYGKVYMSLQYNDNVNSAAKEEIKSSIASNFTNSLSVMSITNEFVEPVNTYIEINSAFNYNPELTGKTRSEMKDLVKTYIINYFNNEFGVFEKAFRKSNLLTEIDNLDRSILSSRMDIKVQQRFYPALGVAADYVIQFPVKLQAPNIETYVVSSTDFLYYGLTCKLRNRLGTNIMEIVSTGAVVVDNAGTYDYKTGTVYIENFNPTAVFGGVSFIKLTAEPLEASVIQPLRNYIIAIDTDKLFVSELQDQQQTRISL